MPEPMHVLVRRLEEAGDRRAAASAPWSEAAELAAVTEVLRLEHGMLPRADDDPDAGVEDPDDPSTWLEVQGWDSSPLASVGAVLGLDLTDQVLLWVAAAGDLDASVGLAYGLLRGVVGAARPTVALCLELAGLPTATPPAFARLGASSALRRHRLVEVSESEPRLSRQVLVPDSVVAALAGGYPVDTEVEAISVELVSLEVPDVDVVARGLEDGVPLVWLRSPAGQSGTAVAAGAFDAIGLHHLAVDLRRHPGGPGAPSLTELGARAARLAALRNQGLVVTGCEVVQGTSDGAVMEVLRLAAVPVVAVSTSSWNPLWSTQFPLMVEATSLTATERARLWREHLGAVATDDDDLRQTLLGLRLSGEDIVEAARYAHVLAGARGEPVGSRSVREAARRVGGAGGSGADRMTGSGAGRPGPRFADLVLPDHVSASLHQLVSWARHRDSLSAEGMLRGRGRGIAALFTGNPGTGKTLSAHVIAEELSIDLFQVDLSSIVDKYIGETEKNLERVFQAAEALDVVLFFDEADALFGSRSEVSDSKDRYANQEVAYLLQRMENFDGITLLSTNLRGNLDRAFSRRMSFIVHFPDPDAPTRARLWDQHLTQLGPLDADDPVNVAGLADAVEIAGGEIRNIVLSAAYDAAGEGVPVGNRHVVAAAVQEYRKLGRVVPDSGFSRVLRG